MTILQKIDFIEKINDKLFSFFFLFFFIFTCAQVDVRIDNILKLSLKEFSEHKYFSSLNTADYALKLSRKKAYSKGITVANIYIAKVLQETGFYKNALEYLDKAEKELYFSKYVNAEIEIYRLRSQIYGKLRLNHLAIKECYKHLNLSVMIEDPLMSKRSMSWAHENIASIFSQMNKRDSVLKHLKIQKEILKSFPRNVSKDVFYDLVSNYNLLGREYLINKDIFTSRKYIDSAMCLLSDNRSPLLYMTLNAYGDLEDASGNVNGAVKYYRKSLKNAVYLQNKDAEKFGNKVLADYFDRNNLDYIEGKNFLKRYHELSDSLRSENDGATELVLNSFIKKKGMELQSEKTNYISVIGLFIILVIFLIVFLSWKDAKKNRKILQIEYALNEKENVLKNLVNKESDNKLSELLKLGKRNDPQFIIVFKELYPDIVFKLQKIDSTIKNSELTFLAMIYLNFSTKNISEYTHVTIRAVQIRKNRIRKKYNIASELDLSAWIHNL